MTKVLLFFVFLFSFIRLLAEPGFSPVSDAKPVEQKLMSMSGSLHSIQSDFEQEKHMSFLDMKVLTKGKFWFKKENSLRWEYTDPFSYVVVIKDGNLTISDDGNNNEMKMRGNRVFQQVNQVIVASVKGEIMRSKDFDASLFESSGEYLVKLLAKNPEVSQIIPEMHLFFDKSSLSVSRIKMMEPNGDHTTINFINRKVNVSIPDSVFNIK